MRACIGGVEFDDVTMQETTEWILQVVAAGGPPHLICTGNVDHLVSLASDPDFLATYRQADLVLADGMPVVWLSRLSGKTRLRERVAGSDLFWELARLSHERGIRLFFLGGSPGSAVAAAEAARCRYPAARIVGIYSPPFERFGQEEEQEEIRRRILEVAPDVLLVAFGAPKQEKWILANRTRINVPVSIGVGGSFEMASGAVRRAPAWMQRTGLEWVHRLCQEPNRMWKRYILRDLPFFAKLLFQTVTKRSGSRDTRIPEPVDPARNTLKSSSNS